MDIKTLSDLITDLLPVSKKWMKHLFVIGIRKLDVRDKGFALMIASVTIVVICQVLPLVFAIVVKGWRG